MKGAKPTLGEKVRKFVRNSLIAVSLAASITAGCSGGYQQPIPLNQYGYVDERVVDMIDLIGQAQMPDWYSYGMTLYERDNIRIVTDKELSQFKGPGLDDHWPPRGRSQVQFCQVKRIK